MDVNKGKKGDLIYLSEATFNCAEYEFIQFPGKIFYNCLFFE